MANRLAHLTDDEYARLYEYRAAIDRGIDRFLAGLDPEPPSIRELDSRFFPTAGMAIELGHPHLLPGG